MSENFPPRILSVGQCNYDDGQLNKLISKNLNGALERAPSAAKARELVASNKYDLVLVNRIFDESGESGLEFIKELRALSAAPVMLISNYADAQNSAVEFGAVPGFGKNSLNSEMALECLKSALNKTKN